jgi:uncharacterized membrane protein
LRPVLSAIQRWEEGALVDAALAERLRSEVAESSAAGTQRLFQYVLATTGATILVIAGGVFLDWAWPQMTEAIRTFVLATIGLGIHLAGTRFEGKNRWIPAAYLLQTAGIILLAVALAYSERAWPDLTAGGIASGVVALSLPFVLGVRTLGRNEVMPAVHLAVGLQFVAIFLERATPVSHETLLWVLDGVLLAMMLALFVVLRRDRNLDRNPWALNTFALSLYSGFALVLFTADAIGLGEDAVYALDAWLFLAVVVTVYGIHWAPEGLRRGWFGTQLALCQLVWIPIGMVSTVGMGGEPESGLMAVGGSGLIGFLYGREHRVAEILAVSGLSIVFSAWFWGVERAGALGAVFALAAAAALLFWFSGKGPATGAPRGG